MFGAAEDLNAQGTNLDKRWKVMVGAPLVPNQSSCKYTVTSFKGVTRTGYYTLRPTVDTMCTCDSTVMAGIKTVTTTAGTRYLVCAAPMEARLLSQRWAPLLRCLRSRRPRQLLTTLLVLLRRRPLQSTLTRPNV